MSRKPQAKGRSPRAGAADGLRGWLKRAGGVIALLALAALGLYLFRNIYFAYFTALFG